MPALVSIGVTDAFTFTARLVGFRGVGRTVAIRGDQTLDDLHAVLQDAFDWDKDHLYAFWLSGRYWDRETMYCVPFALEPGDESTETRLDELELQRGQKIAYVFDFGDEWRVDLRVRQIAPADDGPYPRILASKGEAPPQYVYEDELGEIA
jgi:hypothetical protein